MTPRRRAAGPVADRRPRDPGRPGLLASRRGRGGSSSSGGVLPSLYGRPRLGLREGRGPPRPGPHRRSGWRLASGAQARRPTGSAGASDRARGGKGDRRTGHRGWIRPPCYPPRPSVAEPGGAMSVEGFDQTHPRTPSARGRCTSAAPAPASSCSMRCQGSPTRWPVFVARRRRGVHRRHAQPLRPARRRLHRAAHPVCPRPRLHRAGVHAAAAGRAQPSPTRCGASRGGSTRGAMAPAWAPSACA